MSDLSHFSKDVFGEYIPVVPINRQPGMPEEIYYIYDPRQGRPVKVYRRPAAPNVNPFTYRAPEPSPYIPLAKQALRAVAGNNIVSDLLETYESLEKKKQQHYNRQRFVDPDLWQGNGRQILDNEPDQWDCDQDAIAHNLNGDRGNMDCRGRVGTPREHQQMIVAPDGTIVNSNENMGTYDFVSPNEDMRLHFQRDVAPWIAWGNNPYDRTGRWERGSAVLGGIFNQLFNHPIDSIRRLR